LDDDATVFFFPFPNTLEEFFSTQVVTGLSCCFTEFLFNADLGSDTSVVRARKPQNFGAILTSSASQDVLNGVIEDVTKV
jgi:hypothetical protein